MLLLAVSFVGASANVEAQSTIKRVGDVAENFVLTDAITGESVELEDYSGSIVLLDFFFYW